MKKLKDGIDAVSSWMGLPDKTIYPNEMATAQAARRSVVLRKNLKQGEPVKFEYLDWLRPGDGIPPDQTNNVTGKIANTDLQAGTVLTWDVLGA